MTNRRQIQKQRVSGLDRSEPNLVDMSTMRICKQIHNQDVELDRLTCIIEVGEEKCLVIPSRSRQNRRWGDLEKLTIPLGKLIEHYTIDLKSQNKSPKTIDWYGHNLRYFERWLRKHRRSTRVVDLNIHVVRDYIIYLQDDHVKYEGHPYTPSRGNNRLSDHSVQDHVRTLKAFSSWLEREGYLVENILARLKVPKAAEEEIQILTPEEIGLILSCCNPNTATGVRNRAAAYSMLDGGLRISEAANLKMANVDFDQGQVLVTGKGNKQRFVPLGNNAQKYLQRWIYHFRPEPLYPEKDNVFLTLEGKPLTDNSLRLLFTRLKIRTGIKRLHAHLLRHTFATMYLRNGGDLISLQKILGHASLDMVRRYSHLVNSDIKLKHRRYSPMDRLNLKTAKPNFREKQRRNKE